MFYLIVYSSITFATRIKKHFMYDRDYVGVVHTPSEISRGGCSYSVKVKPNKLDEVVRVSNEFGFKIKGIFRQSDDGSYTQIG